MKTIAERAYRLRPLRWRRHRVGWQADTPLGLLIIKTAGSSYGRGKAYIFGNRSFERLAEAKACAAEWLKGRLLPALEELK